MGLLYLIQLEDLHPDFAIRLRQDPQDLTVPTREHATEKKHADVTEKKATSTNACQNTLRAA